MHTLHRLFRYKAWANDQLLTILAGLGSDSPVTGPAIRALSHSYVVDRIFAAHLRRRAHAYICANLSEMPTLEELSQEIRESDREYIAYVATLDREALEESIRFAFTDGAPGCMTREEMLVHVINHGTGHRGQISAVMLLNGLSPAADGFTTYLHEAEASTRGRSAG
ncbi:DinB family protein [Fulvimonas yonginensis]|uniref:DinB family protein n=1 Tax=Fulvimonas yonginensis TaxID=1495200 RepID=A0ABU8JDF2_9GAMM